MAIINMMLTLAKGTDPFLSFLKGGEKVRAVEIKDGSRSVSLKAYRHNFQEVVTKDASGEKREDLFRYRGSEDARDTLALIERVYQVLRGESKVEVRHASTVHHPKKDGAPDLVSPETSVMEVQLYYPDPIGAHGQYNWNFRDWKSSAAELANPLIRQLVADKARVFPRYARKAFGHFQPGDFVGLGGPDAHLFRNDPEAVAFIRRHTAIKVALSDEQPSE